MSELTRIDAGVAITEVVISPELAQDAAASLDESVEQFVAVPAFWAPGHFRLFVTHVSTAKKGAHAIKAALAEYQIAAFVAHDDIEPTREWEAEIESALRTMDALTAIITPDFISSRWCDQEVGIAIGREKLVVPLRAGADPHGFLAKYQAVFAEKIKSGGIARRIFETVIKHDRSHARMSDALVERLVNLRSWDMSKGTIALLEQTPRLNRDQVARLVRAVDENPDVKDAFGVPARIKALVGRVGQADVS